MSDIVIRSKKYLLLGRQGDPQYMDNIGIYLKRVPDDGRVYINNKIYLVFLYRNQMRGWNLLPVQEYLNEEYRTDPYFAKAFSQNTIHPFQSQNEIARIVFEAEIEIDGVPV